MYTIEGLEARMLELRELAGRSRAVVRNTDRPAVSRTARRAAVVAARAARARKRWTR